MKLMNKYEEPPKMFLLEKWEDEASWIDRGGNIRLF